MVISLLDMVDMEIDEAETITNLDSISPTATGQTIDSLATDNSTGAVIDPMEIEILEDLTETGNREEGLTVGPVVVGATAAAGGATAADLVIKVVVDTVSPTDAAINFLS